MPEYRMSTLSGLLSQLERQNEEFNWYNHDVAITIAHDDDEDEWVAVVDLEDEDYEERQEALAEIPECDHGGEEGNVCAMCGQLLAGPFEEVDLSD